MLSKTKAYEKVNMVKLNGCLFLLKMMNSKKTIMVFWMKSAIVLGKNLIVDLSTIKNFLKPK